MIRIKNVKEANTHQTLHIKNIVFLV